MSDPSTNVAATLQEIAVVVSRQDGLVFRALKRAKRAASKGGFEVTMRVRESEFRCEATSAELRAMGFDVDWRETYGACINRYALRLSWRAT